MVQVATFGIELNELILFIDVFFIAAVLALAATSGNWNVIEHGWNILNNVFFNGASLDNPTCAQAFNAFPAGEQDVNTDTNFITSFITGAISLVKGVFNIVVGILTFMYSAIVGCGFSMVRLIIGWAIILSLFYPLYQLRHLRK
jgi:hypothetical protein